MDPSGCLRVIQYDLAFLFGVSRNESFPINLTINPVGTTELK